MVTASLLALLEQVEDPELPTINIVELGLVRDVSITDGVVTVNITPTYSGCPVMEVLRDEIIKTLNANGFSDVRVETILAPPWTTDWMSESARQKLKAAGIAPPQHLSSSGSAAGQGLVQITSRKTVLCPRCNQVASREISSFGPTACKSIWYCDHCAEPFEYFKDF